MEEADKQHFGLTLGQRYINIYYTDWGAGDVFLDETGKLKINFDRIGIKSILSQRAASQLSPAPEGMEFINRAVYLDDGQLVIVEDANVGEDGITRFNIFREHEPRILVTNATISSEASIDLRSLTLVNEWFKFKNNLPITADAIRMIRGRHRVTHCYNCTNSGLDNKKHYECNSCGWIMCPSCGACGCGYAGS
jgi:hypothetical protein